jgi:ribonuclease HI
LGGVGGIIYFFISHTISFKVGIGPRPKNLVEMLALKLTFTLTTEYGITRIQIFGDLLLIMNWFNKKFTLRNFTLQPLFDEIWEFMEEFTQVTFSHIFQERNKKVNSLSK